MEVTKNLYNYFLPLDTNRIDDDTVDIVIYVQANRDCNIGLTQYNEVNHFMDKNYEFRECVLDIGLT